MFAELPDGRLLNTDRVNQIRPLNGIWRVVWADGRHEDLGGETAEALVNAVKPKRQTRKQPTK